MLRNHHANPPIRIPETARMCMPGPGLVEWSEVLLEVVFPMA